MNAAALIHRIATLGMVAAMAGCVSHEFPDSSRLYGLNLDAARAIYGEWTTNVKLDGKQFYIWRRGATYEGQPVFCELWVEVAPRNIIGRRFVQGHAEACKLF